MAICPDSPEAIARFWQQEKIPFSGLADPKGKVLGLYQQQIKLLKLGRLPSAVLVDKAGLVRYRQSGSSMTDTVSAETLLKVIQEIEQG